jgi:hypothetical protein
MCRFQECIECLERGARIHCQSLLSKVVVDGDLLFFGDGVNDCIGLVLLGLVVISKDDGHVGSVHAATFICERVGTLGGDVLRVIGVTTLGSNGALVMSRA